MSFDPAFAAAAFPVGLRRRVATITLNRPERKNPLTFEATPSCATPSGPSTAPDVKAVVMTGAGGNFCSGGDVHEIIGPLTKMDATACSSSPG